jgi:hypothetical protein
MVAEEGLSKLFDSFGIIRQTTSTKKERYFRRKTAMYLLQRACNADRNSEGKRVDKSEHSD